MKKNEDKSPFSAKVVPAVGLLLFGERVLADSDLSDDEDVVSVPEPSTLALFAIGAAAAGVVHAANKRRKK